MRRGKSRRNAKRSIDPTIGRKGRTLEKVVQWLYEGVPDAEVVPREFLPSLDGEREWEIDVLVTRHLAGVDVRAPIECKNEGGSIGKGYVRHFIDKLNDVGIPASRGLMVATTQYTAPARRLAREYGVTLLVVDNLTSDRLAIEVYRVIQSIVFLVPTYQSMFLLGEGPLLEAVEDFIVRDDGGTPVGSLLDFVWFAWLTGHMSSELGRHTVSFEFPDGWHRVAAGQRFLVTHLGTAIQVDGLILDVVGEARRHSLREADSGEMHRFREEASFDMPTKEQVLQTISTLAELQSHLKDRRPRVTSYVRVPRVRSGSIYWPPSERVVAIIAHLTEAPEPDASKGGDVFAWQDLEGSNLARAWDPICRGYFAEQSDGHVDTSEIRVQDMVG